MTSEVEGALAPKKKKKPNLGTTSQCRLVQLKSSMDDKSGKEILMRKLSDICIVLKCFPTD